MAIKQAQIMATTPDYLKQLQQEIEQTPEEYRGLLLRIVHSFREGVTLPSASDSFKEGWQDVMQDNTQPVESLWKDLDAQ